MTTYFVTGGRGYIGTAFCDAAEKAGHHVMTYDIADTQDIAHGTQLNDSMCTVKPDWVVHLAATPGVATGEKTLGAESFRDIANTRNVLQAMQLSGCKNILFMSTASVYGSQGNVKLAEETCPMQQTGYYAASKLAIEGMLGAWQQATPGAKLAIIRLGTVLGPGNPKGFVKDFVRRLKKDPKRLEILGDGNQVKSFVHIDDLVQAMMLVHQQTKAHNVVNVATGDLRVRDAIKYIALAMNLQPETIEVVPGEGITGFFGDVPFLRLDTDWLRSHGYDPHHTPGGAVTDNVKWLLEHPEVFG